VSAPKRIIELVGLFERNISSYKSGIYNETQVRNEFINPFFTELGWDVENRKGYAEAYKDVIHEYSQKWPTLLKLIIALGLEEQENFLLKPKSQALT